jgi:hypothetical protein
MNMVITGAIMQSRKEIPETLKKRMELLRWGKERVLIQKCYSCCSLEGQMHSHDAYYFPFRAHKWGDIAVFWEHEQTFYNETRCDVKLYQAYGSGRQQRPLYCLLPDYEEDKQVVQRNYFLAPERKYSDFVLNSAWYRSSTIRCL